MYVVQGTSAQFGCVCGHPQTTHSSRGDCHVPGCPCVEFLPMPEVRDTAAAMRLRVEHD